MTTMKLANGMVQDSSAAAFQGSSPPIRINRDRLQRRPLPWRCQLEPRLTDLGRIGHITHTATISLLQEARDRFLAAIELRADSRFELVVASLTSEFALDLRHPAPIVLSIGVLDIGRSSFRIAQTAEQGGQTAVYAEVVQVARTNAGALPLPEDWRRALDSMRLDLAPSFLLPAEHKAQRSE